MSFDPKLREKMISSAGYQIRPDGSVLLGHPGMAAFSHQPGGIPFPGNGTGYMMEDKEVLLPHNMMPVGASGPWMPQRVVPQSYPKIGWRKGKWLDEEEAYTKKLIEAFNNGHLHLPSGTTLRSFLSERLSW